MQSSLFDTLLRLMNKLPGVRVAEARRPDGSYQEGHLRVEGPAEVLPEIAAFLASPGAIASTSAPLPNGYLLISPDGESVVTTLVVTPSDTAERPPLDGVPFWAALYQALCAIGRGEAFTAHGHLERCRGELLALYRLALAPGKSGEGWGDLERLPGAERPLGAMQEWLVCPLDLRAQWRCAHKLATAYEGLMLPLAERLGASYPWPLRNLVFQRLDSLRPAQPVAEGAAPPPAPEPEEAPPQGPAKFKVKLRKKAE